MAADQDRAHPTEEAQTGPALLAFFRERAGARIQDIEADADLFQSGVLDSFEILQLVLFIEERFGVSLDLEALSEDDLRNLSSIQHLIARARREK
jgi:acyl carrier protein